MKKGLIFIIAAILAIAGWHYRFAISKYVGRLKLAKIDIINQIKEDISAPPPLIGDFVERQSHLTVDGVISWTNTSRAQNGSLPALKENAKLDEAVNLKLQDMFKQQYFEHVNPQGHGPSYLANTVGYSYISIGENLALGNFADDKTLVEAWMNSPGHRANILNGKYMEIGVAVGKGLYEGRQTWLAVQEFGKPASSCPEVDMNLKSEISLLKSEVDYLEPQLTQLKTQLDSSNPKTKQDYDIYNKLVAQYNDMVKIFNNKVDRLKQLTDQYNIEVKNFNACASQ